MHSTPQSPARTHRIPCTQVARVVVATGLHVACAGDRAALHCSSPNGTTIVYLPLSAFVEGARGERDGNGRPYPPLKVFRREASREILAADAAVSRILCAPAPALFVAPLPEPPPPGRGGRRLTPEQRACYEAALADHIGGMTKFGAARAHGLVPSRFTAWTSKPPQRRAIEEARARGPVLKPGGHLL